MTFIVICNWILFSINVMRKYRFTFLKSHKYSFFYHHFWCYSKSVSCFCSDSINSFHLSSLCRFRKPTLTLSLIWNVTGSDQMTEIRPAEDWNAPRIKLPSSGAWRFNLSSDCDVTDSVERQRWMNVNVLKRLNMETKTFLKEAGIYCKSFFLFRTVS